MTTIINTVNSSQVLKERLKEIQMQEFNKVAALQLPVKTRWCYIVDSIQSVLNCRTALLKLAHYFSSSKYLSQKVKDLLLNEKMWIELDQLCFLLKPLKVWISVLESDNPLISKVPIAVYEISEHLRANLPLSPFTTAEENEIYESIERRSSTILHPIHFAANILDPSFQGNILNDAQKMEGMNHILRVSLALNLNMDKIQTHMTEYTKKINFWNNEFLWRTALTLKDNPRIWWTSVCSATEVSQVANIILSLPPTSAATERSFSLYSHIHTKKRNRLTSERAAKVVYVGKNLQTLKNFEMASQIEDIEEMDTA